MMESNEELLEQYISRTGKSPTYRASIKKYLDFLGGADPMSGDLEAFRTALNEQSMKKETVTAAVSRSRKFVEWLQSGRPVSPVEVPATLALVETVAAAPMVEPSPVVPVKVPEAVQLPMFPDSGIGNERKTAKLNVYVPPSFARACELLADFDGVKITDFVYRVLCDYVEGRREDVNFLLGQEAERQKRRAAKGL